MDSTLEPGSRKARTGARVYRSRAHVANNAVRIFLQAFGREYDLHRKLDPYNGGSHFEQVLAFFLGRCCYCGDELSEPIVQDHLVPINREAAGLHAWGNVVPSCQPCNGLKQGMPWADFLAKRAGGHMAERYQAISEFIDHYRYRPNVVELIAASSELYEEVGRVAQALIDVKLRRCAESIDIT